VLYVPEPSEEQLLRPFDFADMPIPSIGSPPTTTGFQTL
jgi:hypothetical protein